MEYYLALKKNEVKEFAEFVSLMWNLANNICKQMHT